jgi:ubiquinone/menaquinone biosynthesis C-methylase UbiE
MASTVSLPVPLADPAPILGLLWVRHATELLVAAVAHLDVFGILSGGPLSREALGDRLRLADRPTHILVTALRAMGLLVVDARGDLALSPLAAEHLGPGSPFDLSAYVSLGAASPGVLGMVERLRTNRPVGASGRPTGTAFISRAGNASAMEHPELAREYTLALAGRSRSVAPLLAERLPVDDARTVLDVGGGTGLYSVALLGRHPGLRAVVLDRPEVLRVTAEVAARYGMTDRLACVAGDMLVDELPRADLILLSNVLHDWDVPDCRHLIGRCARALPPGGRLVVHDVFLHDTLDGPLAVALFSSTLLSLTEGRAYSASECGTWLCEAGLRLEGPAIPTIAHSGFLIASRPT